MQKKSVSDLHISNSARKRILHFLASTPPDSWVAISDGRRSSESDTSIVTSEDRLKPPTDKEAYASVNAKLQQRRNSFEAKQPESLPGAEWMPGSLQGPWQP